MSESYPKTCMFCQFWQPMKERWEPHSGRCCHHQWESPSDGSCRAWGPLVFDVPLKQLRCWRGEPGHPYMPVDLSKGAIRYLVRDEETGEFSVQESFGNKGLQPPFIPLSRVLEGEGLQAIWAEGALRHLWREHFFNKEVNVWFRQVPHFSHWGTTMMMWRKDEKGEVEQQQEEPLYLYKMVFTMWEGHDVTGEEKRRVYLSQAEYDAESASRADHVRGRKVE